MDRDHPQSLDSTDLEQLDVSDAAARDWNSLEDETNQELHSEPWAREIDSTVLMGFLSDFRSATREKLVADSGKQTAQPAVGANQQVISRFKVGPAEPEPWELDPYVGAERQVAPDWWIAADGRWYAPELHPDAQVALEAALQAASEPEVPDESYLAPAQNVVAQPEVRTPRVQTYRFA